MEHAPWRPPAVSGLFYDDDPERLRRQVRACYAHPVGPGRQPAPWGHRQVVGLVVPHAGFAYSGPVAAHAYLRLSEAAAPEVVVIIGPDHAGRGSAVALAPQARWQTPLGDVTTDHPVKAALHRRGIPLDGRGHASEHSVEVQLPFLQMLGYDGPVLPIVMARQDLETAMVLAEALAASLAGLKATLIASTDLSHYLPHVRAVDADRPVLEALERGDAGGLLGVVERGRITMCGAGPAAVVLEVGRRLGATRRAVLRYATSGETGGSRDSVVGYVAASFEAA
ncbi:MAG: AmmeMemoRadiSam system protein B [Armatimonadota bacterium]|nr:AmmeMemoRadiSam system protein B [Armatimonadota bacterium]